MKIIGIFIIPLGLLTYYTAFKDTGMDALLDFIEQTELSQDALKRMAGAMIAMVPSGLFLLTTFTFAASVLKLSKHQTLVRQLYSIETLARVDMICLDKTGTITDGTMKVDSFVLIEDIVTTTPNDLNDTEEPLDLSIANKYDIKSIVSSMNAALSDNNADRNRFKDTSGRNANCAPKKYSTSIRRTNTARFVSKNKDSPSAHRNHRQRTISKKSANRWSVMRNWENGSYCWPRSLASRTTYSTDRLRRLP
ncbi:MAG: hypothetical protein MZU97_03755 [Bacillus subtilis]|nr:hypothetical protein [Bacillus subtilis]